MILLYLLIFYTLTKLVNKVNPLTWQMLIGDIELVSFFGPKYWTCISHGKNQWGLVVVHFCRTSFSIITSKYRRLYIIILYIERLKGIKLYHFISFKIFYLCDNVLKYYKRFPSTRCLSVSLISFRILQLNINNIYYYFKTKILPDHKSYKSYL